MTYERDDFLDTMGRYKTLSLFLEISYDKDALYTLSDVDKLYEGKLYPSLKKLYLQEEDLTEYRLATKHLAGWKQWQRLLGNTALRKHIEEWRLELELMLTSRNLKRIESLASEGNYNAAKYIANKDYGSGKGRPTKAEKQAALESSKVDLAETLNDANRVLQFIKKD